ncbi:M15 family metallopeptidase [Actinoplanes sp. NPDC051633]|uniref:M15 family metallopeptidase n=1 Tax=Actinoplanes sp. NPDC051633 TaxID=3155670 RepID=UPI003443096B
MMRRGDQGQDVLEVQYLLGRHGLAVDTDGNFGPETETAVEDFQAQQGLEVDGIVGPDTMAALRGELASTDPEPSTGPAGVLGDDVPLAVENPGGGRITDKTEPASRDRTTVAGLGGKVVPLHRLAAAWWGRLVAAARADGIPAPLLLPVSGLRTMARQQELFTHAVEKYGSEEAADDWVARPGSSAHHSGRAIDCWLGTSTGKAHAEEQRETAAWRWLTGNAERFGFYPYDREPWHWEYNPPADRLPPAP